MTERVSSEAYSFPWWAVPVLFFCGTGLLVPLVYAVPIPVFYQVLYASYGFCENAQSFLYAASTVFGAVVLYRRYYIDGYKTQQFLYEAIFFFWSFFMLGEETRWGMIYFSSSGGGDLFSFQNLFVRSISRSVEMDQPYLSILSIAFTRLFFLLAGFYLIVAGWWYRHQWPSIMNQFFKTIYFRYLMFYVFFFLCGLYIELVLNEEWHEYHEFEETFELNAAFVWCLLAALLYRRDV